MTPKPDETLGRIRPQTSAGFMRFAKAFALVFALSMMVVVWLERGTLAEQSIGDASTYFLWENLIYFEFCLIILVTVVLHRRALWKWYLPAYFLSLCYVIWGNAIEFFKFGVYDSIHRTITHDIANALYLSAMTITTVGYGDLVPGSNFGRLVAGVEALSGYLLLALLVALLVEMFKPSFDTGG